MSHKSTLPEHFRDQLRLLQSQMVLLHLKDGSTFLTYLRTALVYIGKLEILKEEYVCGLMNKPLAKKEILSNSKNYEFISLDQVLKVEAGDLPSRRSAKQPAHWPIRTFLSILLFPKKDYGLKY